MMTQAKVTTPCNGFKFLGTLDRPGHLLLADIYRDNNVLGNGQGQKREHFRSHKTFIS